MQTAIFNRENNPVGNLFPGGFSCIPRRHHATAAEEHRGLKVDDDIGQHLYDPIDLLMKRVLPDIVNEVIHRTNLVAMSKKGGNVPSTAVGYTWRRQVAVSEIVRGG